MPQMMPLNWLILFFYFILIFLLLNIFLFFSFNTKLTNSEMKTKSSLIDWKW